MERKATQPLNPQEAKARLRAAASGGDMASLMWRSPQTAVLVAFIIGFAAGTSSAARKALASGVVSLFTRSRLYSPPPSGRGGVRAGSRPGAVQAHPSMIETDEREHP